MATITAEQFERAVTVRDRAAEAGNLAQALEFDDWLEDHGLHSDDRATCYACQSWASGHDHRA